MRNLSLKSILVLLCFALMGSVLGLGESASAAPYDPSAYYGYSYTQKDPAIFQATDGNERLRLKKLADIERASAPTIHYDNTVRANYMCDWTYDRVVGRYVCNKNYQKAFDYTHPNPIPICPFGYHLDYGRTNCTKILVPMNGRLNARGDGWECNPGYHVSATGSRCLGPEELTRQCPGGTWSCGSSVGCQSSPCKAPCATTTAIQPIFAAVPVIVQPIVVLAYQELPQNPNSSPVPTPAQLPQTGPAIGLGLLGLSGLAAAIRKAILRFW